MGEKAARPNVLMVSVDQWPGHLLGAAGRDDIDTPTLDRLAGAGRRFTNATSECPICIPARRSLMTGADARSHGDRTFQPALPRPALPHVADTFRDAGYQTGAVGKLHVYPPRDRIGFEEVVSFEEGRPQLGGPDDWEMWLAERGHAGEGYAHAMSNNGYEFRPWHLDEAAHPTTWLTRQMCRMVQRRDPTRPAFWHLSYNFPHPPIVPLAAYLALYGDREMAPPVEADWSSGELPPALARARAAWPRLSRPQLDRVRRAFHAQCTHIDHQLRLVIGTLREHLLLDDTIVVFVSDHGDMLGDHGLYAKRLMYRGSAGVPMIVMGTKGCQRVTPGSTDARPVGLADVMPTLLDLAGIPVPATCTGRSMLSQEPRDILYGEALEDVGATRMVTDGRWKLIWYPAGNHLQLFDMSADREERHDLADDPAHAATRERLTDELLDRLYGIDLEWVRDGRLVGFEPPPFEARADRGLNGQRGLHYPEPPRGDPTRVVGSAVTPSAAATGLDQGGGGAVGAVSRRDRPRPAARRRAAAGGRAATSRRPRAPASPRPAARPRGPDRRRHGCRTGSPACRSGARC